MKRFKSPHSPNHLPRLAGALILSLILTASPMPVSAAEASAASQIKDLSELTTAVQNAKNALISAQENESTAQKAYDEAQKALAEQDEAIKSAVTAEEDAKSAYDKALKNKEEADAKVNTAGKALSDAENALESAQKALINAEDAKEKAQNQFALSKESLNKAQTALTSAQKAKDDAQANVDNESPDPDSNENHREWTAYGFFQFMRDNAEAGSSKYYDAQCAMDILDSGINSTGCTFQTGQGPEPNGNGKANWADIASNIVWESRKDAVALGNVGTSLEFLKEFNSIRAEENEAEGTSLRTDIGTNCRQMAVSIVQCDASKDFAVGHTMAYKGLEDLSWSYAKAVPFSRNRYTDPYVGWYDEEKVNYKENNDGETGHYTTIVDKNSDYFCEIAGFAVCQEGASYGECRELSVYGDFSNYDLYPTPDAQYSIDEFTKALRCYYDAQVAAGMFGTTKEVHAANAQALKDAEDALAAAQTDYDTAKAAFDKASSDLEKAEEDVTEAESEADEASENAAACEQELSAAYEDSETAGQLAEEAKINWSAAADTHVSLVTSTAYLEAKTALTEADENLTAAKEASAAAEEVLSEAEDALKAFMSLAENENIHIIISAEDLTYTGSPIELSVDDLKVVYSPAEGEAVVLASGADYSVAYEDNTNAGTASVIITGLGDWSGSKTASFEIAKAASSVRLAAQTKAYTGKATTYTGKVTRSGSAGKITYTYYSDAKFTKTVKAADVKNAGTYYVKAALAADTNYTAAVSSPVKFTIAKAASSIKLAAQTKTYTGKATTYSGKVTRSGSAGKVTYTYYSDAKCTKTVKASNVKDAGTYYVKASLAADTNYNSAKSAAVKFTISKAKNVLYVKARKASHTAKFSRVTKISASKAFNITKNVSKGKLSYAKTGGNAKIVVSSNGKITVKKGLKKGAYIVKVKVTSKATKNYTAASRTVSIKIKVN